MQSLGDCSLAIKPWIAAHKSINSIPGCMRVSFPVILCNLSIIASYRIQNVSTEDFENPNDKLKIHNSQIGLILQHLTCILRR